MDKKIDVELLISLIEERPVIWDKSLEIYKNKVLRETAWREICVILKEDFEEMDKNQREDFSKIILKKWTQVRDSWSKDVKKRKDQKKSGISVSSCKPYKYSDQLSFLKKIIDTIGVQESGQGGCGDDGEEGEGNSIHAEEQAKNTRREIHNKNTKKGCAQISDKEKKIIKMKQPEIEEKTIQLENGYDDTGTEDPQLFFFKSLLPITETLNTEKTLRFQAGVISLLQNIKRQKQNNYYQNSGSTTAQYPSPEYRSNAMDSSSQFSETHVTDVQSPASNFETEDI